MNILPKRFYYDDTLDILYWASDEVDPPKTKLYFSALTNNGDCSITPI